MLYIASDHGGFDLKKELTKYLEEHEIEYADLGPFELNTEDDYPDFVIPVMRNLQKDYDSKAILICRNGVGVNIVANKFDNIRATVSWDVKHVTSAKRDDNINVLTLAADYTPKEKAMEIVTAWLTTPFSEELRHIRRLEKIQEIEELN